MADTGDEVRLVNEGSTFTDGGVLVREGDTGYVIGHRGFTHLIVHWKHHNDAGEVRQDDVSIHAVHRRRQA